MKTSCATPEDDIAGTTKAAPAGSLCRRTDDGSREASAGEADALAELGLVENVLDLLAGADDFDVLVGAHLLLGEDERADRRRVERAERLHVDDDAIRVGLD